METHSQTSPRTPVPLPAVFIAFAFMLSSLFMTLAPSLELIPIPEPRSDMGAVSQILAAFAMLSIVAAWGVRSFLQRLFARPNPQQALLLHVIPLVLVEGGAVFGLVGSILSGDKSFSLIFGGAAVIVMALLWPKS